MNGPAQFFRELASFSAVRIETVVFDLLDKSEYYVTNRSI